MAAQALPEQGYRLGPRVPSPLTNDEPSRVVGRDTPSRILPRSSATTSCDKADANLCEKPAGGTSIALPIGLSVAIPIVVIICVLIYLHRRNIRKVRNEDNFDPHKSLDFGLAMDSTTKKTKRKSSFFGGEKDMFGNKARQLSLDMGLASPYLLPPDVQGSRESLRSLARTLHQSEEDPYRPVTQYAGSDVASLRSFQKDGRDGGSVYARSTHGEGMSRASSAAGGAFLARHSHLSAGTPNSPRSRSPIQPPYPDNNNRNMPPNGPLLMPSPPAAVRSNPAGPAAFPSELDGSVQPTIAELQVPEPAATRITRKGVPAAPGQPQMSAGDNDETSMHNAQAHDLRHDSSTYPDFDLKLDLPQGHTLSPLPTLTLGGPFADETFIPGQATTSDEPTVPSIHLPGEALGHAGSAGASQEHFPDQMHAQSDDNRGRGLHRRQSSEYPQDNAMGQSNLGLPQVETRRLSVGVRPLPPDEVMEAEDPETRANRIRSFYKEYFDDSRLDMAEYNQNYPPNGVPNEWRGAQAGGPGGAPYFDPQSNSFVMPYAQPISRRAMTPPPSGSRFPGSGPRGPPRNFHGSMGGMGMPGRPGPGSDRGGPRPGSSMSGRYGPRKPLPPPEDLNSLPTPSLLKDDSFALLNAIDFAPPPSFGERAAGRSQSPMGERLPYEMRLPAVNPLVSSFDEMAALPSPHLLRKSSTFTGLDFAPPRKFKDPDTMSDAGSIRSNRSGISAIQQAAIRSGAGRVSRLPGDSVFTQADLAAQLKPNWGMRP